MDPSSPRPRAPLPPCASSAHLQWPGNPSPISAASVRLLYSSTASSARLQWSGNPSPISGLPFPLLWCSCVPSLVPSTACACCLALLYASIACLSGAWLCSSI
ncbi:hypothetical protein PVAP13_9KG506113 [Panicum virgatum]|uniref:Uncharacterized protein n=1 Tax=Panicum virgatum TaxID=38727 RepID=A0A8T0NPN6_PANVG|nr:hypothetical protein PVAP13_9KG506113 [Panicum virgatum]